VALATPLGPVVAVTDTFWNKKVIDWSAVQALVLEESVAVTTNEEPGEAMTLPTVSDVAAAPDGPGTVISAVALAGPQGLPAPPPE